MWCKAMEKRISENKKDEIKNKLVMDLEDTIQFLIKRYDETKSCIDARDIDVLRWVLEKIGA